MQKPTQQLNSPFRQKIFDLMKQQETSKILKLSSRMFQNKTVNTSHSPFRQFSIDTQPIDQSKIARLDTSSGALHFKSLQQKLGFSKPSKSKSKERKSNSASQQNSNRQVNSRQKKVSFIENLGKTYYKPSKSSSKNKVRNKFSKDNSLQKNNNSVSKKLKRHSGSKGKSSKKNTESQIFQSSSKKLKTFDTLVQNNHKNHFSSSANYLQSNEKQTQKKNYLLQTLKKMQSVRKNLSQTFQQFDKINNETSRSKNESKSKNKSKQKNRSNLTVLSDYVSEEIESDIRYRLKGKQIKKSESKHKLRKQQSQKSIKNLFHKKTPNKKAQLINDSLQSNHSLSHLNLNPIVEKDFLKQLRSSCKNPQKWQTIERNQLISLHYRVVKRKLIEIQIHAQNQLQHMEIELQKGYFICQSLKEDYVNVKKKEIITLLCSVRGMHFKQNEINLLQMPKLSIKIQTKIKQTPVTFKKQVCLPYSWIMLAQKQKKQKINQSSSKKSKKQETSNRVKTRSRLQGIQLKKNDKLPNIVEIFSFCQIQNQEASFKKQRIKVQNSLSKDTRHHQSSINLKNKDSYKFSFELEDQQFKLFVKLNSEDNIKKHHQILRTYNLQIEGKGQSLMAKMITFLELLG